MLLNRHGESFRLAGPLLLSAAWGLGAAIGVALGGWLTVAGGTGAPGAEGLDLSVDVGYLPLGTFVAVTLVHLIGQVIAAFLRGRSVARGEQQHDDERAEDDEVAG